MARMLAVVALTLAGCTATHSSDDSQVCEELAPGCVDELEPWSEGPKCQRTTYECALDCAPTDGDCLGACLLGDSDAIGCTTCVFTDIAVCGRENGCRCEWESLQCCRQANGCAGGIGEECAACARQRSDWDVCVLPLVEQCIVDLDRTCVQ